MKQKLCYKTSRDMKRLKELLDAGYEVVCFYTYDFNAHHKGEKDYEPIMTTDVCYARYNEDGRYSSYTIGCRGTGFFEYWTQDFGYKYSFVELLEAHDIQFIEPTINKGEAE